MARIGKCHLFFLFVVLFLVLVSLAVLVASIVTDYWFKVDGSNSKNTTIVTDFSYTFGMWRRCYKKGIPASEATREKQGDCVLIYKDFIKQTKDSISSDDFRYINLQRSWVGLLIAAAGLQFLTVLLLTCGLWPGECNTIRRSSVYLSASLLTLLATMAAVAGGICFIALRDLDKTSRNIFPSDVSTQYQWSFILGWIGTGLCLIEGFMFLCLLRMDYDNVKDIQRYQTV